MLKNLLSVIEVATILSISRIAVFKKIKKGQLKAEKYGRNYLISKDDLRNYILQQKEKRKKKIALKKEEIDKIVDKVENEYGETLRMLEEE